MPLTTREPQNGGVGTGLSSATSERAGISMRFVLGVGTAWRRSAIRSDRSCRALRSATFAASAAAATGSRPRLRDITPSISRRPSKASRAYRTSPLNTADRSFST